jgi:hypothetical protein
MRTTWTDSGIMAKGGGGAIYESLIGDNIGCPVPDRASSTAAHNAQHTRRKYVAKSAKSSRQRHLKRMHTLGVTSCGGNGERRLAAEKPFKQRCCADLLPFFEVFFQTKLVF